MMSIQEQNKTSETNHSTNNNTWQHRSVSAQLILKGYFKNVGYNFLNNSESFKEHFGAPFHAQANTCKV